MKLHIENIDENTWLINGVKFTKPQPFKTEWPTNMNEVNDSVQNWQTVDINDLDSDKFAKMSDCLDAARLINGDWVPDWEDETQTKYCPEIPCVGEIDVTYFRHFISRTESFVWFHSEEACRHFIDHFSYIWLEAIG